MSDSKKMYMQVLYDCKNKDTVDSMSWDEFCVYYHMMIREAEVMKNGRQ